AGVKLRETWFRAATGAIKPGPRGERGISRKAIAQGRPDCFVLPCGSFPVLFYARGPRVWRTPGLPCALCYRRDRFSSKARTHERRENDEAHSRKAAICSGR